MNGPDPGIPGGSAEREHNRRRAARARRTLERHPRLGGLLLAWRAPPQHETAWKRGAAGERAVAESLERRCGEGAVLLHDRRMPGTRANIDHLAVAASGVWVIDAKAYAGRVKVANPLFGTPKLTIAGRDRSRLADSLARQVQVVADVAAELGVAMPVYGVFCFIEADLPLWRTLSFRGFPLLHRKGVAKQINRPGALTSAEVRELGDHLALRLPPA
ncbi:MAG: hypothetical protein QOJ97_664 [Solirubrobacteraceae bacterium]|jgi:hypothetical protein|nr:hypothetical protein [Solirubrobacteraceae bacterium]